MAVRAPVAAVLAVLILQAAANEYNSIFFLKFHKVGGTTAAINIHNYASSKGYDEKCFTGGNNTSCVQHNTVQIMRNGNLGGTPLVRIRHRFPKPFLVVVMRHPIEKLLSRVYYDCLLGRFHCDDEKLYTILPRMWYYSVDEYAKTLGANWRREADYDLAEKTLREFHAVSVTDNIPALFAQMAYQFKDRIDKFKYRSARIVKGRPSYESHSDNLKNLMQGLMEKNDFKELRLYELAEQIMNNRIADWSLAGKIRRLNKLNAQTEDKGCDLSPLQGMPDGTGNWCYEFTQDEQEV